MHFFAVSDGGGKGTGVAVRPYGVVKWREVIEGGEGVEVDGVVADGATVVKGYIKVVGGLTGDTAVVTVALSDEKGNGGLCADANSSCDAKSIEVTLRRDLIRGEYISGTDLFYKSPAQFCAEGIRKKECDNPSRTVEFVVSAGGKELAQSELKLVRPPVVLVHGIWGDGRPTIQGKKSRKPNPNYTWAKFVSLLNDKSQYVIFPVDYSRTNSKPFDHKDTQMALSWWIDMAKESLKAIGVVGRKVDVVAHSMGGLVTRAYCANNLDACRDTIRKLLTIDTPHLGSELADWLQLHESHPDAFYKLLEDRTDVDEVYQHTQRDVLKRELSNEAKKGWRKGCSEKVRLFVDGGDWYGSPIPDHPVAGGAVASLATGTVDSNWVPVGQWAQLSSPGSELPTHAVIGHMPDITRILPDMIELLGVTSKEIWWLQAFVLNNCGLSRDMVFHGEESDGIVSVISQAGGIAAGQITHIGTFFGGADHMNVTDKEKVIESVRELLEGDIAPFTHP